MPGNARTTCKSEAIDFVREAVLASLRNDKKLDAEISSNDAEEKAASTNGSAAQNSKEKASKKRRRISSNWKQLQKSLPKTVLRGSKRQRKVERSETQEDEVNEAVSQVSSFMKRPVVNTNEITDIVGMDCEMVGVGPDGKQNALARVSVVNYSGDVLYDKFVKVKERVTDYRTQWSGVKAEDVSPDSCTAVEAYEAQKAVGELIAGRIVVGHALRNDIKVLRISHPWQDIRDTAVYFKRVWRKQGRRSAVGPKLSVVVAEVLGVDTFQKSEHDSCEDARAALALYKRHRKEWEASLKQGKGTVQRHGQSKRNKRLPTLDGDS
ncbi:RNA exonuclease 4 [Gracilariopsis chorda]|uniref:RNA exonuclease 4 n=1 Tax=Gracilariopsis chorda TaxID=448386 RepID=A0A2V3IXW1_9FLOR|nr:RNA exonuclease 4 [Gracilariopsis chorda]|eukprot:PXF46905.1 RNA exonuclease 4 [Gracilariopsis chorda]